MKNLLLVKNRIFAYFLRNKLIFTLFILGGILNAFVLASFSGEAYALIRQSGVTKDAPVYRTYYLTWDYAGEINGADLAEDGTGFINVNTRKDHITMDQAERLAKSDLIEQVMVIFQERFDDPGIHSRKSLYSIIKGETLASNTWLHVGSGVGPAHEVLEIIGGSTKYEELQDDQIIYTDWSEKIGDKKVIAGKEFEIASIASNTFCSLITPSAMKEVSGGLITAVVFFSSETYDEKENPVTDLAREIFSDYDLVYTDVSYPLDTVFGPSYYLHRPSAYGEPLEGGIQLHSFYERLITIVFCYFMSQVAFLILLRYLLNSLAGDNAVSIIVGMKKRKLFACVFTESLLLSVIPAMIGLILHKLLSPSLFSHITSVYYLAESFQDYAILFLIMAGVSVAVLIPFVLLFQIQNPVELRRRNL